MDSILNQWTEWLLYSKHKALVSANSYYSDVLQFLAYIEQQCGLELNVSTLQALTRQHFRQWLAYRQKQGYQDYSTRKVVASIRSLYAFLEEAYGVSNAEPYSIKLPKAKRHLPRPLTIENALASIECITHISRQPWVGIRDRAILTLLYSTGMRIGEALALNDRDVWNGKSIYGTIKVKGKGNRERLVHLLPITQKVLACYIALRPRPVIGGCPLFIGTHGDRLQSGVFQKAIVKVRKEMFLEDTVTPHAFRHSFATHMMENGTDIVSLQKLLGHSCISNTQIYTKVSDAHAMEVYRNSHPNIDKSSSNRNTQCK